MLSLLLSILIEVTPKAHAWAGRGHDVICEVSVHLLKEEGLKQALLNKGWVLGDLCNKPDTYWRSLSSEITSAGNPTHYFEPDAVGISIKDVPADWSAFVKLAQGRQHTIKQKPVDDVHLAVGSSWWRVDQFMRRMADLKNEFAKSAPPTNPNEEQSDSLPYNKATYELIVNMGLMGHFIGDMSQPLHTTADYDGWARGHGGIHSWYEDTLVAHLGTDLEHQVFKKAKSLSKSAFLKGAPIERMRKLTEITYSELDLIYKHDPVITKSTESREKGMSFRTPAVRKAPSSVIKKYEPIIVTQLARASALLASLMDEAYVSAGRPDLTKYRSFRYPHMPEFVPPDYLKPVQAPKNQ
ncbi:MAG: hypothetical protein N2578_05660 [Bdellovibrionaceae bacterium]|nr:hypothetical protein [Pseudobdellovibrionaceae bacterium]